MNRVDIYSIEKALSYIKGYCQKHADCKDSKQPKVGEWIPVSEKLPENEVEVQICARHKYRDNWCYTITSAHHQDGTMHTEESRWSWSDCDFEYCEETDDWIIFEGWWEKRHYNPDDVYNNLVDDEVIAWMPLPEPYKGGIDK